MKNAFPETGARVPLDLGFKGDRTYLHGTDMFDALLELLPGVSNISLRIHNISRRPLDAVVLENGDAGRAGAIAIFSGDFDGEKKTVGLFERSGTPDNRYAYDEADVTARAEIDATARYAAMARNANYSFIEQLVALQKALLQSCYTESSVRWYFTRLNIARAYSDFGSMTLRVTKALGTSLVCSSVSVDGAALGEIYFSGVKE